MISLNIKKALHSLTAVIIACQALPAIAQVEKSGESLVTSSLKTFGALVLVLVLIVVLSWLARRYLHFLPSTTVKGGVIKVLETKPLGPKRSLHVVEIEGRKILIGSSEGGIALLQK
ncbi:flagellar biosynthetic protein FliO, partial [bacterium]|nr:flagellar biosynthetic protein FliO [bacterium]